MLNELDIVRTKYTIYLVKNKDGYIITNHMNKIDSEDLLFKTNSKDIKWK